MAKYSVMFEVYAHCIVEVEADSEQDAQEKAELSVERPQICWHCSQSIDVGDVGDVIEVMEIEDE